MTHQDQRPATPTDALAELLAGNERFVTGTRDHPHQDAEHRAELANGQRPFAVVFGCSDSRLAAEIIFDRGLGDLFVVRTAGQAIGPEVLASVEYGVSVLDVPLIVVLGHDSCGAIAATDAMLTDNQPPGDELLALVERVVPSVRWAHEQGITDRDTLTAVHVQYTVDLLLSTGRAISEAVSAGRCAVIGMSYHLADGRVSLVELGPVGDWPR